MSWDSRIFRWWLWDYPPLDGRVRAIAYLMLLALGWNDLVRRAVRAANDYPDGFFEPAGIMQRVVAAGATRAGLATNNELRNRVVLFGINFDGSREDLRQGFPSVLIDERLWTPRLRNALFDDLRAGVADHAPKPRSQKFLDAVRDKLLAIPKWSRFLRFELVFLGDQVDSECIIAWLQRHPRTKPFDNKEITP